MFAQTSQRADFADTRAQPPQAWALHFTSTDTLEQMAQSDAADRSLLRLVMCAACATLMLALAVSLGA
jgi:hypothetical protein